MVYIDWKRIEELNSENFTDDEKDELLQTVSWYVPTPDVTQERLLALIRVMQDILKYKTEQVESLLNGIEQLAAKQGEDLAMDRQEMMEEMEQLRTELESLGKFDGVDGNLKSEVLRLKDSNEKLMYQFQEKEKDVSKYKSEYEHLTHTVERLEQEKGELNRELALLQEQEGDRVDSSVERNQHLTTSIRQKNKHILQLLEDIEILQHSAEDSNSKLIRARQDLQEVENVCSRLREEMSSLTVSLSDCYTRCNALEAANSALKSQVKELNDTKAKNEEQLDEFALQLSERVDEWRRILDSKQLQITLLQKELEKAQSGNGQLYRGSNNEDGHCGHEMEMVKLHDEIKRRTDENVVLIKRIEDLKSARSNEESLKYRKRIQELEEDVIELKNKLVIAEGEAAAKGREICDLINKFKAYENGIFGLPEATEKIAKLEVMIQEKNNKIEELVVICNKLQMDRDGIITFNSGPEVPKLKQADLARENDVLISEIADLRFKNRELQKQLSNMGETKVEYKENSSEEKHIGIIEENDMLRKCMHDILSELQDSNIDSFRLNSLEQLLQAMDSRHVAGWYHPAMRLQAQLHTNSAERRALKKKNKLLFQSLQERQTLGKQVKQVNTVAVGDDTQPAKVSEENRLDCEIKINEERSRFLRLQAEWEKERSSLVLEKEKLSIQLSSSQPQSSFQSIIQFFLKREETLDCRIMKVYQESIEKEEESLNTIIELQKTKASLMKKIRLITAEMYSTEPVSKVISLENELKLLKAELNFVLSNKIVVEPALGEIEGEVITVCKEDWQNQLAQTGKLKEEINSVTSMCEKMQRALIWAGHNMIGSQLSVKQSGQIADLEEKHQLLLLEKTKAEEMVEMLRKQLKYLSLVKDGRREQQASMKQCLRYLQSNNSSQLAIVELSQELANEKARGLELQAKLEAAQNDFLKRVSDNMNCQSQVSSLVREIENMKIQHLDQLRVCYELLQWYHELTNKALAYPNVRKAQGVIKTLVNQQKQVEEKLQKVDILEESLKRRLNEVEIHVQSHLSKENFSDSSLVGLQNAFREARLNEGRYISQIKLLTEELQRMQEVLEVYKNEASSAESREVQSQTDWEKRVKHFVEAQLHLCRIIQQGGGKKEVKEEVDVNSDLVHQVQLLKKQNGILMQIVENQKSVRQGQPQFVDTVTTMANESLVVREQERRALQTAVVSLQNLVNQKEKTINRYCQLLKSCKQGQKGIVQRLRLDLANLFETLAQQSSSNCGHMRN